MVLSRAACSHGLEVLSAAPSVSGGGACKPNSSFSARKVATGSVGSSPLKAISSVHGTPGYRTLSFARSNARSGPDSAGVNAPSRTLIASDSCARVGGSTGRQGQCRRGNLAQTHVNSCKNQRSLKCDSWSCVGGSANHRSHSVRCSSGSDDSDKLPTQGSVSDGGAALFETLLETSRKPPLGLEIEELKLDAEKNKEEGFGDEETREDAAVLGLKHGWNKDGGGEDGSSEAELQGGERGSKKNGSGGATPGGSESLAGGQKSGEIGRGVNGGRSTDLGSPVGSGGGSGSSGLVPPPDDVFYVVESSKDAGVDYLGESTKFDMNMRDIRTPWLRKHSALWQSATFAPI